MRKMGKPLVVLLVLAVSLSCIIGTASAWGVVLMSANEDGDSKDVFEAGETVYCYAKTVANSEVDLYVVPNKEEAGWNAFAAAEDSLENLSVVYVKGVTTNAGGYIQVTPIWTPGSGDVGDYDIVLDANQDDILNFPDLIDCVCEVGFSVNVPEFATIAMPVGAILGLLFFFNHKRKKE